MIKEWVKLREEGLTYQAIANKYNITKQAIWDALNKLNIPRQTKHTSHYQQWENLYHQGISIQNIAQQYNCSTSTVYNYLSKKVVIDASNSALRAWKKRRKKARKKSIESQV